MNVFQIRYLLFRWNTAVVKCRKFWEKISTVFIRKKKMTEVRENY